MKITRAELLDVVYRFYPRGLLPYARIHVPPGEPFYDDTEEHLRLVEAANHGRAEYSTWKAMIRRLGDRYGLQNESLSLLSGNVDPAYSARIWLTDETALSFHVSLLGPYYGIHLPGIPEEEPVAREIAREIEATYPGYEQVPPELGDVVVPDVTMFAVSMGEATIGMFLFSDVWTWVKPKPWRLGKGSVKHTQGELLDIVYRYYPRGVGIVDGDLDVQAIHASEEHARLVAARRKAATDERWPAMQRRIEERFPDAPLVNQSLHLPTGDYDACYSFTLSLPGAADDRRLWFQVSFLAPYYIVFSSRLTGSEIVTSPRGFKVVLHGMPFHFSESEARSMLLNPDDESLKSVTVNRREFVVSFDLSPDERPYVEWIAREIEATFGCEHLPPEAENVLVPDVATNTRIPGQARLFDCLFSDDHPRVMPSASETWAPTVKIEARHLTDRSIAVITVFAALFRILRTLRSKKSGAISVEMDMTGVLLKEQVLWMLAWMRSLLEPPVTPSETATKDEIEGAMREIEALVAAWDGNGAPPDAMVAWASSFLASWDGGEDGGLREG